MTPKRQVARSVPPLETFRARTDTGVQLRRDREAAAIACPAEPGTAIGALQRGARSAHEQILPRYEAIQALNGTDDYKSVNSQLPRVDLIPMLYLYTNFSTSLSLNHSHFPPSTQKVQRPG